MRIIDDIKLDFSDVLIAPKRSQLISRKDAKLTREFKFKHSNLNWSFKGNTEVPGQVLKVLQAYEVGWNFRLFPSVLIFQNFRYSVFFSKIIR